MGASGLIFLALYCLKEYPTAFVSQNIIYNLINYTTEKKKKKYKARQQDSNPCWEVGGSRKCLHCIKTRWDPNRSPNTKTCLTSHCIWCSYIFLTMLSKAYMTPAWPSLTVLNLTSFSVEWSWYAESAEFQLLTSNLDNTLGTNGRVEQVKMKNKYLSVDLCPIICEGQHSIPEDNQPPWKACAKNSANLCISVGCVIDTIYKICIQKFDNFMHNYFQKILHFPFLFPLDTAVLLVLSIFSYLSVKLIKINCIALWKIQQQSMFSTCLSFILVKVFPIFFVFFD